MKIPGRYQAVKCWLNAGPDKDEDDEGVVHVLHVEIAAILEL